jgi:hypothetical protein
LCRSVAVVVVPWDTRLVDRQLLEVWTAVSVELGVEIREDASLEERVLCEVNAPDQVTNLVLRDKLAQVAEMPMVGVQDASTTQDSSQQCPKDNISKGTLNVMLRC